MKDIKKLREEQRLTIYKLSKLSGISQDTIKKIEEKEQSPTLYTLALIAKGLNVALEYLIDE